MERNADLAAAEFLKQELSEIWEQDECGARFPGREIHGWIVIRHLEPFGAHGAIRKDNCLQKTRNSSTINSVELNSVECVWTHHELRLALAHAWLVFLAPPDAPYTILTNVRRSRGMDPSAPNSEHASARQRPLVGCLISLAVMFAVLVGAIYIAARPAMPRRPLRQVTPGMAKAEVRKVLGDPQEGEGCDTWVYWRWGNAGWVEVYFDQDGTLDWVNDESAFP